MILLCIMKIIHNNRVIEHVRNHHSSIIIYNIPDINCNICALSESTRRTAKSCA